MILFIDHLPHGFFVGYPFITSAFYLSSTQYSQCHCQKDTIDLQESIALLESTRCNILTNIIITIGIRKPAIAPLPDLIQQLHKHITLSSIILVYSFLLIISSIMVMSHSHRYRY